MMMFSLSLFAFLSSSVLVVALPLTAIQSKMEEQVVVATHQKFLLAASTKSHQHILRRRHLQDSSTDCQAAYETLYEDPTLLAAAETWLAALDARVAEPDTTLCNETETSASCDLSEEVPGTQELLDACTGAGGTPQSMEMDISCSVDMDGETLDFMLDFPTMWECLPPNCEEELAAIVTSQLDTMEEDLEAVFSLFGSGTCDILSGSSEDTLTPGGSDTSPPPATAPTTGGGGSGAMMARDTMLSTLLVLVCGALVAM
ncbi:hypothetical protein IV203_030619 [Nitzschia inconspicua]|uniref:Uncharacterized protein n=1 Tax=Nitzschia inconspicua TaxID=303405 RepID=A0A9K3LWC4_9STRA|nr:hypothetical protein IV203_015957 [Nitzschia inconspicua]KAG7367876.1 hypothetical protein IV203_030619 [Nitzschia inconspicua]